jgi:hypothetical protein
MNILVNSYPHYDYLQATCIQGLRNLGHNVYGTAGNTANYLQPHTGEKCELFIQGIPGMGPNPNMRSVMLWGQDDHVGLMREFELGFDAVFVRDKRYGQPGYPIHFGIEDRYYCAVDDEPTGKPKPLAEREIDVCFLGDIHHSKGIRKEAVEKLPVDFPHLNLVIGPRRFNEPDDRWSATTLPWCAHDPRYFETLANSKICLSFQGAGPDCARHWEVLASGAVPIIEVMPMVEFVRPTPGGVRWFFGYEQLRRQIEDTFARLVVHTGVFQHAISSEWVWNRENHSTRARAAYMLRILGYRVDNNQTGEL